MGKKNKNIYAKICTFENLFLAYRKARKGKRSKKSVYDFEYDLENNLFKIQEELLNEDYKFSEYNIFKIHEPKERIISSAIFKDRVVHHAICNIVEPVLDKAMIYNSYSCRIGKGTHKALEKAAKYLKNNQYILKLDIKKYFFTIDHEILLNLLENKIRDKKVLALFRNLLNTYKTDDFYYLPFENDTLLEAGRPRGLPIGNLTSQLFANFYLNSFDRFIKEELQCKNYLRYMDDALIFSNSKAELREVQTKVMDFLKTIRLKLNTKKSCIIQQKNGIPFLGFHLYKNRRRILKPNLTRFKNRMIVKSRLYSQKEIDFEHILISLNSWCGFKGKNEHKKVVNNVLKKINFRHPGKNYNFTFYA